MAQTQPALPLPPGPQSKRTHKVCISNLPHDADEFELLEICYSVGAASTVDILRQQGCAYCEYADESEVLLACEDLNGKIYRGKRLRFEPAANSGKSGKAVQNSALGNGHGPKRSRSPRRSKRGRVGREQDGQTAANTRAALEITNLSPEVTEEDLSAVFSSILGFVSVRLEKEATCGILGGRAICDFQDASLAQEASDMMQGIDMCGLEMAVALLDRVPARPKPDPAKVLKFRCTQCDEGFAKWPPCRTHLIERHPEIVPEDKWKLHPDDFRAPE
eukprot:TRINITY_DN44910_c0_g1_i1.p1 TRINITY_DN44910_c0_g1~~TRINITY_DN44910_c0_g1_i1.p1  ORF type:complete len:276 (+),score=47.57 TRINITY_DN44910_c0_g1_i1:155-982(+)